MRLLESGGLGTYVDRTGHSGGLDGALARCVPAVLLPRREDQLCVGVGSYELGDERGCG